MEGYVSEMTMASQCAGYQSFRGLLKEGFVREIISKVQTMRKEADFQVTDKIRITYEGTEKAEAVFAENEKTIGDETLAELVEKHEPAGYVKEWKINGEKVVLGVEKDKTGKEKKGKEKNV